jgi:hypothetical protein
MAGKRIKEILKEFKFLFIIKKDKIRKKGGIKIQEMEESLSKKMASHKGVAGLCKNILQKLHKARFEVKITSNLFLFSNK